MRYISSLKLEKITDEQRENLNQRISTQELEKAIKNLKPNKAPGPDGFTAIYYKLFKDEIIPYLKDVMKEALERHIIPSSWEEANIIVF